VGSLLVTLAALATLFSTMIVLMIGLSRVPYAMSRDGLLPGFFSAIAPRYRTAARSSIFTWLLIALLAGLLPVDVMTEMVSIGTLLAVGMVSFGIRLAVWFTRASRSLQRETHTSCRLPVPQISLHGSRTTFYHSLWNHHKKVAQADVLRARRVCKIKFGSPSLYSWIYRRSQFQSGIDRSKCNPVLRLACRHAQIDLPRRRQSGSNRFGHRSFNMYTNETAGLTASPIFTLADLGLEGVVGLDQASRALADRAEGQIIRWVQFPAGALFFTLVQDDPESGAVYVLDRRNGIFYYVDFDDQKWGGYSLTEYEALERTHRLSHLAQRPTLLARILRHQKTN
jgi:hypothetical protein